MSKKPKMFEVTPNPQSLDKRILFKGKAIGLTVEPSKIAENYCAIINVADSPCATFDYQGVIPSFWFPIHEHNEWGHSPFFAAIKVVNKYFTGEKPVLIHCHAGANRSPSVAYAIMLSKGYTPQEIEESLNYPDLSLVFQRNIDLGHIPTDIIQFLEYTTEQEGKLESLHFLLRSMDSDYERWAASKMARIKDSVVHVPEKKESVRMVYNSPEHRFQRTEVIKTNY